ncbi:scavenger receptor cysteine-rich type 1 protein M130-like [Dendronephthya gigantea]|uniref:scavenger receptor cysteine-rich type 1 protein M130-like n=1 Tax=Dendronephthya gigantea TaxID=151771 RepID=UPI0010694177|nr:scavenger receptor cysteine-rich type 1 protein M130-like [Dendronephthya gigantea]
MAFNYILVGLILISRQCEASNVMYGPVRLQGPLSENGIGRVEVSLYEEWGTICGSGWGIKEAKVVCHQLGYPDAVRALYFGQFPSGVGRIWLAFVRCDGDEQNITSCSHKKWKHCACGHFSDVGVECSKTVLIGKPVPLRLRGPLSANGIGRVEVLYAGKWGTICDFCWNINSARVACRQLGYSDAVRYLQGEPASSGPIWLDGVACTGREQNLTDCSHYEWGSGDGHCPSLAGVECISVAAPQHGSLRLQGPLSENGTGRVEVFYHGQWGTICDDTWDVNDARVVCRQLGYPDDVRSLRVDEVTRGTGHIWLDQVACTGKETNITSCVQR